METKNDLKQVIDNLFLWSKKSIPYDLCEQIIKEIEDNKKPNTIVLVRRKVCENCGKTFMFWEEIFRADQHREIHGEKSTCDKCGVKLKYKKIYNGSKA